jgi:hypothetical protein
MVGLAVRLREAHGRRWNAAAARLTRDLQEAIGNLHSELALCRQSLGSQPAQSAFASPREIYADLLAIQQEFHEFEYCLKAKTLTAVTEPITFSDVRLGRFAIELRWESLRPVPDHSF